MALAALGLSLLLPLTAAAQGVDSPHAGGSDPTLPQPESKAEALHGGEGNTTLDSQEVKQRKYATPGLPSKVEKLTTYKGDYFSFRLGFVALADYNAFWQDADSEKQVGAQRDQWDTRSLRFLMSGGIGPESFKMHYFAAYAFNGFSAPENGLESWHFSDLNLTLPAGKLGAVTIGKGKEWFIYEMSGDATFLPQLERVLNPFFTSRDIGVVVSNAAFDKRLTYRTGWFNDGWIHGMSPETDSNHVSTRVTGLVRTNAEGSRYLHLAVDARYAEALDGVIRLKGKAESNVTSDYVDTGKIAASNQRELAFEGLWTHDGYSINAEYVRSWVDATQVADPSFYGLYVTGSWIITGEHRPYDRNVGYARRPIPRRRLGAVEVIARYSRLDLDDKSVHGGVMDRGTVGVNWYPNRFWKLAVDGGVVNLDRAGLNGLTWIIQPRIQFFY
jgi:phosphate-selective porin OprO and OprP